MGKRGMNMEGKWNGPLGCVPPWLATSTSVHLNQMSSMDQNSDVFEMYDLPKNP